MITYYLKPIWNNIKKNKLVSFINISGLAIGMSAAVLIFLWVQNETSFDNYHPRAKNIYSVVSEYTDIKWVMQYTPLRLAEVAPAEISGVEKATRLSSYFGVTTININGQLFPEKTSAYIDKNWFDVFHYDVIEGSIAAFNTNPFSIIMTESKAKTYFGRRSPVGQVIKIDSNNYQVQAVIKDNPANSSFQYDLLLPLDAYLSDANNRKNDDSWRNSNYLTFFLLQPNANVQSVKKATAATLGKYKNNSDESVRLLPLSEMHFETGLTSSPLLHAKFSTVYIFTILGLLLLLIACINYVNLTTAQASLRSKEVSVRKIVGAGRAHLFKQFMAESLFISLVALLITIIIVELSIPMFNRITDKHFVLPLSSVTLWMVMGGTLIASTLLNGVYPAIFLSSFKPLNFFRGINTLKIKKATFRKALVTVQFTVSVILIIGTIVITKQLYYIEHTDPGYDRSQIFSFSIPYKVYRHYNEGKESFFNSIKQELLSQSSIKGVTLASQSVVNLTSTNSGSADWDGHDTSYTPTVSQLSADGDFKNVMGLALKEGRWFQPDNKGDEHNFILNETAVKQFDIHKPVLGQRFSFQGDTGQIIGIVKDFHFKSLHEEIAPLAIFNKSPWRSTFFIKTQNGMVAQALREAADVWKKFVSSEAFDYTFLDESFDKLYKTEQRTSKLIFLFSVIAIVISALGLFGLTMFSIEQRTKEIGIRKVLGASVYHVLSLLSKDFIMLVIIASAIAFPIAWWGMNKWLSDFAYRINIGWWIFVVAGLISLLIATITISVQGIKAALANPVKNLRTE